MTLPVSGPLSFSDINVELAKILQPGRTATAPINFNEADIRWLANKIVAGERVTIPDDFYGKGYFNVAPNSTVANEGPVPTTPAPVITTTPVPTTTTPAPPIGVITVTPFQWTWDLTPITTTTAAPVITTTTAAPVITTTTAAPVITTTTAAPVITTTTTPVPMPLTISDFGLWYYDIDNADNSSYGNIVLKLNVKPDGQWAVSSSTQYGPVQYHSWNIYSIPTTGNIGIDNTPIENGSGALSKSGLWFNSITPGIGNNYWVRFSGHAFVSGVDFFGYDAANPTNITNRSAASANMPFNSGWLSLSAERTVQIQNQTSSGGGGGFGTVYGLFNPFAGTWSGAATMEIAADSGGTNIVQTTQFGLYSSYRFTYNPNP
jgi:hypothetical protein